MLSKAFIVCVLDERIVFISPDFNLGSVLNRVGNP